VRRAAAVTAASLVRPLATAEGSVLKSVDPISMSVPLLSAYAAAASSEGALMGGPLRLWTAPQSVVMMAFGDHACLTSLLRT